MRRTASIRTPQKSGFSPADKKNRRASPGLKKKSARSPARALNFSDCDDLAARINPSTPGGTAVLLSAEQESVVELCEKGENVFFSGGAGTGKSVLLSHIVQRLSRKYQADQVFVTATTGLAACNIGGTTVHQFAGVGRGDGRVADLIKYVQRRSDVVSRWRQARVLVIDEIGMMPPGLFEALNSIAKAVRGDTRPFGGIQLILTGDFFQVWPTQVFQCLPPQTEYWIGRT